VNPLPASWKFAGREILCDHPVIIGIINVTPDSFSDGGKFLELTDALNQAKRLVDEGADILDIGGESSRPGSESVEEKEEIHRVVPLIESIRNAGIDVPISVDTRKLSVAAKAVNAGAEIVNDISALRDDPELADFVAEHKLGLILMHMLGTPKNMQENPVYSDIVAEIGDFLHDRKSFAESRGVEPDRIVLDPGIGFGKTLEHNLTILRNCAKWLDLGRPIMVGPSRKRFIGAILDAGVEDRLSGTIGACVMALAAGARIFRVHDVRPVKDALRVAYSIIKGTI
jgi:dihydropteroate synthase